MASPRVKRIVARLPSMPGVYRFRDETGRVLYIGRASDLRRRVASYWGDLGDRRHLVRMVSRIERIDAVTCDSEHEAAWLERNLLEESRPRWNRTAGGQEVPVYIRIDPRAGLQMVHTRAPTGRHFGPYLGGVRVSLAVSALDRLLPLAYATEDLSGSARDMARIRGVAPADREGLLSTIVAVLERRPEQVEALRAGLVTRRDAAASELAFEFAGRVQAEIEALDWVVAEQRVTVDDQSDIDVHGWADGILVSFEMRGGRVRTWRQRDCTEAVARPLVETTPADWSRFAERNARLAAHLATA